MRRKLQTTVILVLLVAVVLVACAGAPAYYVGSVNSDKFHNPDCKWAKKIKAANLVEFKTRAEAISAGYKPCKVCKP